MNNFMLITALTLILVACGGADFASGNMTSNGSDGSGGTSLPVEDFAAYVATLVEGAPQSMGPEMIK